MVLRSFVKRDGGLVRLTMREELAKDVRSLQRDIGARAELCDRCGKRYVYIEAHMRQKRCLQTTARREPWKPGDPKPVHLK